jgi:hypothetical protein
LNLVRTEGLQDLAAHHGAAGGSTGTAGSRRSTGAVVGAGGRRHIDVSHRRQRPACTPAGRMLGRHQLGLEPGRRRSPPRRRQPLHRAQAARHRAGHVVELERLLELA